MTGPAAPFRLPDALLSFFPGLVKSAIFVGIAATFVVAPAWVATGGAAHAGNPEAARKLKVATTFTIIADMAQNVGGDHAEVTSITRAGEEIHQYQPTPRDILRAQGADVILINGLNLDLWLEKFLPADNAGDKIVVSDGVTPLSVAEGPYRGKANPHAWMSPTAAAIYVDNIRDALSRNDPAHADAYRANAAAYKLKIDDIVAPIRARLQRTPERQRWLATSEGAFTYLAEDFGLRELYLWPINAEQQGAPQQVRRVIDAVRAHNIPAIFSESTISDKPARQIARETGARYGGALYVDTLSSPDGPVPTYLDLLQVTLTTIADGVAGPQHADAPHGSLPAPEGSRVTGGHQ